MPCSCSATTSRSARLRAASARDDREGTEEAPGTVCTGTGEDLVALRSHNLSGVHVGSMWRQSLHRRTEGCKGEHPSSRECREAAAVPPPGLRAGGFAQAPPEAVSLQLRCHPCLAAECRQSLCCGALTAVSPVGSLGHGAQSPRAAILLWAQPSPPSHSSFLVLHLAHALLSRVPAATVPVYFLLAPLSLCQRWSSAEDLAVAAAPGSSLRSPGATLAPSPSCPFCEAVQFSCRSLRLIPGMG